MPADTVGSSARRYVAPSEHPAESGVHVGTNDQFGQHQTDNPMVAIENSDIRC